MSEELNESFAKQTLDRAISDTFVFFRSTRRDIFLAVSSLVFGFGLYWYFKGLPSAIDEAASVAAFTFGSPIVLAVFVFLFNLWLAPAALAYEAAQVALKNARAIESVGTGQGYCLADDGSKRMAGRLVQLGEIIMKDNFKGFKENTTEELYFNDIIRSTHVIWTRPDALKLRRDFEALTQQMIIANKKSDVGEHNSVKAQLTRTIETLSKILLHDDE